VKIRLAVLLGGIPLADIPHLTVNVIAYEVLLLAGIALWAGV
jgi:hypothetical protein